MWRATSPIGGNAVASAKCSHCRYGPRSGLPIAGASRPVPVLLDQVLEDRARLGHDETPVLDHRELAARRVLLERMARRLECDGRELVRNAELLQQPDDANRAGELRVVELDHRRDLRAVGCRRGAMRWPRSGQGGRFSATATCSVGAGGGGIVGGSGGVARGRRAATALSVSAPHRDRVHPEGGPAADPPPPAQTRSVIGRLFFGSTPIGRWSCGSCKFDSPPDIDGRGCDEQRLGTAASMRFEFPIDPHSPQPTGARRRGLASVCYVRC